MYNSWLYKFSVNQTPSGTAAVHMLLELPTFREMGNSVHNSYVDSSGLYQQSPTSSYATELELNKGVAK